ncbi:uncharacterized protein LOC129610113 [Condylostylus longicornis]|uniref:uncharacterized protein LOC129610113 n=1 Tax=Condylostylus longicornis TaxID=2530218 RepID=UPI00244E4E4C|nr:uncharacterized protein LOC129610113 [Condylostylus longicornis]
MENNRSKIYKYYNSFCEYMQEDTRGAKIAIYSVAGVMFLYAYHRIRPITKFGKATDIPKLFIREKTTQYGKIEGVDASHKNGPVLLINHKPPLNFLIPFKKVLPVNLSGVSVNANGCAWLQTVAVGRKVEFIPIIERKNGVAECQVVMLCPNYQKDKVDISKAILELGFGKYEQPSKKVLSDPHWKMYHKYLTNSEKTAKNQRLGFWLTNLPPKPWIFRKSKEISKSLILSILPKNYRLPELVR